MRNYVVLQNIQCYSRGVSQTEIVMIEFNSIYILREITLSRVTLFTPFIVIKQITHATQIHALFYNLCAQSFT